MKVYTEEQLKKWFKLMKIKYANSNSYEHLKSVEMKMFDNFCSTDNLKEVLKDEKYKN